MKNYEFKPVKTVTIAGKRGMLRKYIHGDYYQFNGCRIPAQNADQAIEKLKACAERRIKQGGQIGES